MKKIIYWEFNADKMQIHDELNLYTHIKFLTNVYKKLVDFLR